MDEETPAATLKRLVSTQPVPCNVLAAEGEEHYLHPVSWIDQMVLDAILQDFLQAAKAQTLSDASSKGLIHQIIAIGTVQLSLRKGAALDASLVFPSLQEAAAKLKNKPKETWKAFEVYSDAFEVTPEEKKS